jgi:hypothetical protein
MKDKEYSLKFNPKYTEAEIIKEIKTTTNKRGSNLKCKAGVPMC